MYMSRVCHVYVMYMSCMSCVSCHVYVMCMSCICHVYVMYMSCVCHVHVVYMSSICHIYVRSDFAWDLHWKWAVHKCWLVLATEYRPWLLQHIWNPHLLVGEIHGNLGSIGVRLYRYFTPAQQRAHRFTPEAKPYLHAKRNQIYARSEPKFTLKANLARAGPVGGAARRGVCAAETETHCRMLRADSRGMSWRTENLQLASSFFQKRAVYNPTRGFFLWTSPEFVINTGCCNCASAMSLHKYLTPAACSLQHLQSPILSFVILCLCAMSWALSMSTGHEPKEPPFWFSGVGKELKLVIAGDMNAGNPAWESGEKKALELRAGGHHVMVHGSFHTKNRRPRHETFRHFLHLYTRSLLELAKKIGTAEIVWCIFNSWRFADGLKEIILEEAPKLPSLLGNLTKATWAKQGWDKWCRWFQCQVASRFF